MLTVKIKINQEGEGVEECAKDYRWAVESRTSKL